MGWLVPAMAPGGGGRMQGRVDNACKDPRVLLGWVDLLERRRCRRRVGGGGVGMRQLHPAQGPDFERGVLVRTRGQGMGDEEVEVREGAFVIRLLGQFGGEAGVGCEGMRPSRPSLRRRRAGPALQKVSHLHARRPQAGQPVLPTVGGLGTRGWSHRLPVVRIRAGGHRRRSFHNLGHPRRQVGGWRRGSPVAVLLCRAGKVSGRIRSVRHQRRCPSKLQPRSVRGTVRHCLPRPVPPRRVLHLGPLHGAGGKGRRGGVRPHHEQDLVQQVAAQRRLVDFPVRRNIEVPWGLACWTSGPDAKSRPPSRRGATGEIMTERQMFTIILC
mmetsp:Transcript_52209/g.110959  ORF Transcript_52209/g.110959 Transcript_52209/m.110959 type:complete len:327 (-) Transcript_52209:90-1070(-)